MGSEEQAEKLISPTEKQVVKAPGWSMLAGGLIFVFLHYTTEETFKYGRIDNCEQGSTGETGNQKLERTKIVRWIKREKVTRRELNFSFPTVPQIQSLNTTKTTSSEHTGRTRVLKTVYLVKHRRTCTPGYMPLHSRYLTEETSAWNLAPALPLCSPWGEKEGFRSEVWLGLSDGGSPSYPAGACLFILTSLYQC